MGEAMQRRDRDKADEQKQVEHHPTCHDFGEEDGAANHPRSSVAPQRRQLVERRREVAAAVCGESDLEAFVQLRQ